MIQETTLEGLYYPLVVKPSLDVPPLSSPGYCHEVAMTHRCYCRALPSIMAPLPIMAQ